MATSVACDAQPISLPPRGSDSIAVAIAPIWVIRYSVLLMFRLEGAICISSNAFRACDRTVRLRALAITNHLLWLHSAKLSPRRRDGVLVSAKNSSSQPVLSRK